MRQAEPQLKSHKLPECWHCPACGLMMEGATPVRQPQQSQMTTGKIIVCAGCATVSIVDPLGLRQMKNEEIDKLPNQSIAELNMVVGKVRQMIAEAGRN